MTVTKRLAAFILVTMGLFLAGCATLRIKPEEMVLARVNGWPVSLKEVKEEFRRNHIGHLSFIGSKEELAKIVNRVIESRLLIEEAYRIGLEKDKEIEAALDTFRLQKMKTALYLDEVLAKIKISEEEMKNLYQGLNQRLRVWLILTPTEAEAREIQKALREGANFAQLARESSWDNSAKKGGDLGYISRGRLAEKLEKVAFQLQEGETSGVVSSARGYAIVRVEERREVERPEFSRVEKRLKRVIRKRKESALRAEFLRRLRAQGQITINESLLSLEALIDEAISGELILTRINEKEVKFEHLRRRVNLNRLKELVPHVRGAEIRLTLNQLIDQEIMAQEAQHKGYGQKEEIVRQAKRQEEYLILTKLVNQIILAGLEVTEEEVRHYYQGHAEQFTMPGRIKVGHILVSTRKEAEEILARIRAGASFEQLAKELSQNPLTAAKGGEIGWLARQPVTNPVTEAAFSLNPGEVSGPVEGPNGFHLIKVWERKEKTLAPFSRVKGVTARRLLGEKRQQRIDQWLEKLKASAEIEVKDEVIQRAARILSQETEEKFRRRSVSGR